MCVVYCVLYVIVLFYFNVKPSRYSFSALTPLVWRQEGHPACKKLDIGLHVVTIKLELCTFYGSSYRHHLHHALLQ